MSAAEQETPFDVLVLSSGDSAEAATYEAALAAVRTLQDDARSNGHSDPTAFVYFEGKLVSKFTRAGARR